MDPIKEAFLKIKSDIIDLKKELILIKEQINNLSTQNLSTDNPTDRQFTSSENLQQTNQQTHIPTHILKNSPLEGLYPQNSNSSTGNKGVPTNRQTDKQTNRQTQNQPKNPISEFKKANDILNSLDDIKQEIRLKFRRLTPQEMIVFSTLYSLENQKIEEITYKTLSNQLNLSESSIRDYTNKLISKGVPIDKIKQNNKTILLKISSDLKNIASLDTIIRLREL